MFSKNILLDILAIYCRIKIECLLWYSNYIFIIDEICLFN